jgi:hypothetical protein
MRYRSWYFPQSLSHRNRKQRTLLVFVKWSANSPPEPRLANICGINMNTKVAVVILVDRATSVYGVLRLFGSFRLIKPAIKKV